MSRFSVVSPATRSQRPFTLGPESVEAVPGWTHLTPDRVGFGVRMLNGGARKIGWRLPGRAIEETHEAQRGEWVWAHRIRTWARANYAPGA